MTTTVADLPISAKPTSAVFLLERSAGMVHIILALVGSFFIYHGITMIGCLWLALVLLHAMHRNGIEVDRRTRQYRYFILFLNFRIGDWETLPDVQRVVLKFYSDLITHGKPGRMRTDADKRYIIMFSIPNSTQGVILHESYNYSSALQVTKALAEFLEVEAKVYDQVNPRT